MLETSSNSAKDLFDVEIQPHMSSCVQFVCHYLPLPVFDKE